MLRDIAILTGGEVITEELALDLKETDLSQLGRASKVVIEKKIQLLLTEQAIQKLLKQESLQSSLK